MWHRKLFYLLCILMSVGALYAVYIFFWSTGEPIKVGILHSQTGTLGFSEQQVINATMLAIEEINAKGGINGHKIEPIIYDGKSDELAFEKGAKELIYNQKVAVIFGCWSSASRKRVKKVVEDAHSLLMYPVQYEGLEESNNIIYTGAAPNQAIIPAVTWAFENIGKRCFFVGSDYVFPRAAHQIIKLQTESLGGQLIASAFIPLGSADVQQAVQAIIDYKPQVIFNAINGSSNDAFFKALRNAGITPEKIPVISFSISEPELKELQGELMVGDYAVWNYFQTIDREENRVFIQNYKKKYGVESVVSNNMESAYDNVYLWAHAVQEIQSTEIDLIVPALKKQVFNGPGSIIYLDENNHAWREIFVGKIRFDRQFAIVWQSQKNVHPEPYPPYQTKDQWQLFLNNLYKGWGNKWARPL